MRKLQNAAPPSRERLEHDVRSAAPPGGATLVPQQRAARVDDVGDLLDAEDGVLGRRHAHDGHAEAAADDEEDDRAEEPDETQRHPTRREERHCNKEAGGKFQ